LGGCATARHKITQPIGRFPSVRELEKGERFERKALKCEELLRKAAERLRSKRSD
jgi:hypothetical protein